MIPGSLIERVLEWLNSNSGAVLAVVTTISTVLTVLLWWATRRQAVLTRVIFQATHRPHVSIDPQLLYPAHPGFIRLDMRLHNHGSVPALVTEWSASFRQDASVLGQSDALGSRLCVFPGDGQDAPYLRVDGKNAALVWDTPVHVHAKVSYRGDGSTVYSTAMKARFKISSDTKFRLEDVEHEVR